MSDQRTIIVGDVHGCLSELKMLLKELEYTQNQDHLIFVGDLINKGPDSYGVLKYVHSLKADVVIGNHELAFLQHVENPRSGHAAFDQLQQQMGSQLSDWVSWISDWPHYLETSEYLVVHAGLTPEHSPAQTPLSTLVTIRTWDGLGYNLDNPSDPPWYELYTAKKLVVFGHWARKGLVLRKNAIGLDTGCVYGKQLSAVVLPERKLYHVEAQQVYLPV